MMLIFMLIFAWKSALFYTEKALKTSHFQCFFGIIRVCFEGEKIDADIP